MEGVPQPGFFRGDENDHDGFWPTKWGDPPSTYKKQSWLKGATVPMCVLWDSSRKEIQGILSKGSKGLEQTLIIWFWLNMKVKIEVGKQQMCSNVVAVRIFSQKWFQTTKELKMLKLLLSFPLVFNHFISWNHVTHFCYIYHFSTTFFPPKTQPPNQGKQNFPSWPWKNPKAKDAVQYCIRRELLAQFLDLWSDTEFHNEPGKPNQKGANQTGESGGVSLGRGFGLFEKNDPP